MSKNKESGEYSAKNIVVLEGLEAVRKRPGMYIGGVGENGLHHLVYEIIDNSADEALAGFCKNIKVVLGKDGYVSVEDDGRGIPVGEHSSGKNSLEIVLTKLHAGGKFNNNVYQISGGLHGVGLSVVNALSEHLIVEVKRDGKIYYQEYRKGQPITEIKVVGKTNKTGTKIAFKPDKSIFETTEFNSELIKNKLKSISFLIEGLKTYFESEINGEKQVFYYKQGILEFLENEKFSGEDLGISDLYFFKDEKNNIELRFCFKYFSGEETIFYTFANTIKTPDGGTHLDSFKKGFYTAVKEYFSSTRKHKDKKIDVDDVFKGFAGVISIYLPNPQFEGQTKNKLNNTEIVQFVYKNVYNSVKELLNSSKRIGKVIVERVLFFYDIRQSVLKARSKRVSKSNFYLSSKLADCSSDDPEERELFIVEGDSAGGTAKQARNRFFQAVLPIKGKILNIEKSNYKKVSENEEIKSIFAAIGISRISKHGMSEEDIEHVRYGKIIIMTDADVDGAHIRTLLMTFFWRYMKPLILAGKVYIALPPLFMLRYKNSEKYIWSLGELNDEITKIKSKDANAKFYIQRYKGLGEMNPDQLFETTMNPNTRKLIQLTAENIKEVDYIINALMGKDVESRKEIIYKYAESARIDV